MTWRDIVGKVFLWWVVGTTTALFLVEGGSGAKDFSMTVAWAGVVYGALAAAIYSATNKYRIRHALSWGQVTVLPIAIALAWGALSLLLNNWKSMAPFLLVIGLFAAYVAGGLLILYLAVRVVRAAWRTPESRSTTGKQGNVMSQAPAEAVQLTLSPQEAWILLAAFSTGVTAPSTENVKGFRARLNILGEMQEYSRTDTGREVVARLGTKLLTMIEHVERLEGEASR